MYPVGGWLRLLSGGLRLAPGSAGLHSNVLFLGLTSLLTDISSEMVVSILPVYLVGVLRLSPMQFGMVDGMYQGVSSVVALASGIVSDRWRRHREVAWIGYAMSAVTRAGLLATTAWSGIASLLVVDRIGKGIRTAPRDALISLSVPRERLGVAFGVHRAMDAMGAMLGPVIAFALLAVAPLAFDLVFAVSLAVAIVGLAVLGLFVENPPSAGTPTGPPTRSTLFEVLGVLKTPGFGHLALCALLLSLTTITDAFVYLTVQRQAHVAFGVFPLLYVLTSLGYLLLAVPAGRIADRAGRFPVFLAGYGVLVVLYAILLWGPGSWAQVLVVVLLLGAHYAATEGVLMALGSAMLPEGVRTSGLAALTTITALARLGGAILFGWMWTYRGLEAALIVFLLGLAGALVTAWLLMPRERAHD